jgi:hypothetical protein
VMFFARDFENRPFTGPLDSEVMDK